MSTATLDRTLIERLVREALTARNGSTQRPRRQRQGRGRRKLVVNVSARHCHVTQEDLERLFGKGHKLTPFKALYQDGFFAAEETVTMIGPRHRMITEPAHPRPVPRPQPGRAGVHRRDLRWAWTSRCARAATTAIRRAAT